MSSTTYILELEGTWLSQITETGANNLHSVVERRHNRVRSQIYSQGVGRHTGWRWQANGWGQIMQVIETGRITYFLHQGYTGVRLWTWTSREHTFWRWKCSTTGSGHGTKCFWKMGQRTAWSWRWIIMGSDHKCIWKQRHHQHPGVKGSTLGWVTNATTKHGARTHPLGTGTMGSDDE